MLLFEARNCVLVAIIMASFFVAGSKESRKAGAEKKTVQNLKQKDRIPIEVQKWCDNPTKDPLSVDEIKLTYLKFQLVLPDRIFGRLFFTPIQQFLTRTRKCEIKVSAPCRQELMAHSNLICDIRSKISELIDGYISEQSGSDEDSDDSEDEEEEEEEEDEEGEDEEGEEEDDEDDDDEDDEDEDDDDEEEEEGEE